MVKGVCSNCKKAKDHIAASGKAQGICKECYRKLIWKPQPIQCKRCERMMPHKAFGLCNGCYNSVFHIEKVKAGNKRKYHNIDYETYKTATKVCVFCGFDKLVDLHHLDMNHDNNSVENLTGLCPNHHKMVHHRAHQKEILQQLRDKSFTVPEGFKDDNLFKNPS
ncbi:MAG: hypothetical protein AABW71_01640 [Nanoarchaeota archaeon]